ncbi:citramalate synthase [Thermoanaerobacterium sp. RBIITD]|uniref:citramalate synthase n=1 Tax=Thermoanaerobacterium sp. RBIITD TaxID=1550240 RepID=UPI000BB90C5D|nr:citramalate synthase [Thermoanaerobacterium sp. RBIITD]SNX54884.1 2-isopropylmalate synthase [Thermoanaerobacterium sp. RBIITD]
MKNIVIYDSTLRDGAQAQGISFTVADKIKIVELLDDFGISYIEAGNPGSNPKDMEFFECIKNKKLKNAKVIAFGSTRRANIPVENDINVNSLLYAGTDAVAIFGKSWDFHVKEILKTTLDENLKMIYETIKFFKENGKEVVFDAEHFFDGYMENPDYALKTLEAAYDAGVDSICLCDTKGGMFPFDTFNITKKVVEKFKCDIGIHTHNDNGMAVANAIIAVEAGVKQIQGTINGYGERCGNANLCTIIPNLQLKKGIRCIPDENMKNITTLARHVSEIANAAPNERAPYVGRSAFAHKAGMHSDAVCKNTKSYELVDPEVVGNERLLLLSEVAGRSAIIGIINEVDPTISRESKETKIILEKLKEMEFKGYKYEGAEGSLKLLIKKVLGKYKPSFKLIEFKVIVNEPSIDGVNSSALIKVEVDGQEEITASEGDGPVNALDNAVRKALERFYPEIKEMKLTDYKVRVLDSESATAARVRVIIESSDGNEVWSTIGVSTDIIDASWIALVDSIEYKLNRCNCIQSNDEVKL